MNQNKKRWASNAGHDGIVLISASQRQAMMDRMNAAGQKHAVPLIEAMASGVALCTMTSSHPFPSVRKLGGRGAIVVVGNDLTTANGPSAFHLSSLRKIAKHVSAWAVVSASPPVELYAASAALAKVGAITLLVETQPEYEVAWTEWLTKHGRKSAGKMLITPNAAIYEAAREGVGATRH
jgi:hypothetical protein